MPDPLIGLTAARNYDKGGHPHHLVVEAYMNSVSQAGGIPVLIPLGLPQEQYLQMLDRLDGVIFTGGGDVDPSCFGGVAHPEVAGVDADRDRVEKHLAEAVIHRGMPFLGICRGIQLVNVTRGGTLYTHIPDQHPGAIRHSYDSDTQREYLAHPVEIIHNSLLARLLVGSQFMVNSLHHQGIRGLAPGLRATAYAPDGLIEAVECPDHPFGLSVQWHPECLQAYEPMRTLFRALVRACRK